MNSFAGIIVQRPDNKVLAIKLVGKEPSWRIPGGKIESGESPKEAALRELFEEVGLRYQILTYLGTNHADCDGKIWTGHIFHCALWSLQDQPKIMEPHKIEAMEWVAIEELARRNPLLATDLQKLRCQEVLASRPITEFSI